MAEPTQVFAEFRQSPFLRVPYQISARSLLSPLRSIFAWASAVIPCRTPNRRPWIAVPPLLPARFTTASANLRCREQKIHFPFPFVGDGSSAANQVNLAAQELTDKHAPQGSLIPQTKSARRAILPNRSIS